MERTVQIRNWTATPVARRAGTVLPRRVDAGTTAGTWRSPSCRGAGREALRRNRLRRRTRNHPASASPLDRLTNGWQIIKYPEQQLLNRVYNKWDYCRVAEKNWWKDNQLKRKINLEEKIYFTGNNNGHLFSLLNNVAAAILGYFQISDCTIFAQLSEYLTE